MTTTTGAVDERSRAVAMVAAWLDRAAIPYHVEPAGILATLPAGGARPRPAIELRIGLPPAVDGGLLFTASTARTIPRDQWAAALAMCNDWNGKVAAPRARLCVGDWSSTDDAPIALESYLPLPVDLPPSAVVLTGMQLIRSALQFWGGPATVPSVV